MMFGRALKFGRRLAELFNLKATQTFALEPPACRPSWWRHRKETFSVLLAFVRGIHRLPVNSPYKGQWRGALIFSLICARVNRWENNREAGDLRRRFTHYDVIVMIRTWTTSLPPIGGILCIILIYNKRIQARYICGCWQCTKCVNSLWPLGAIWRHSFG